MTNHIHLIWELVDELKNIAMAQQWIDGARETAPTNRQIQAILNHRQASITARKTAIHNMMFEIPRSN